MGALLQILAFVALVAFGATFGLRGALAAATVALFALGAAFGDVTLRQAVKWVRRPWTF